MTSISRSPQRRLSPTSRLFNFSYRVFFTFLVRYRRTAIGPLWTLVGPAVFVATLGFLYAHIGNRSPAEFIPHIAVGLVTWNLIQHMIMDAASVYRRGRANILQGQLDLDDLVMIDVMTSVLIFVHQCIVIAAVFLFYGVPFTLYSLTSLAGLVLIVLNGVWVTRVIGVMGARYRDLGEVLPAILRIGFLATPIIWMPERGDARSELMGSFLAFNPFHHFIELVRAPLLNHQIETLSWVVVISITAAGFLVARIFSARFERYVALWI